jgi:hypothetical protein
MNTDVYDTYVHTTNGEQLHFDVLLPSGNGERAVEYARKWLQHIGIDIVKIRQDNCRYCHTEAANPEVQRQIEKDGYFILQMEGCPCPAN